MTPFAERTFATPEGLVLAGRDYPAPDGPARLPVVCLHGLTRNARDFEAAAPLIAATGRRVLALDVRGRGRSAWARDPMTYAVPVYVGDMIGWAKALGIGRALFVGTSMGGLITLGLAVAAPGLVAGAVLNDIGPEIDPRGLARIASYTGQTAPIDTWADAAAYAKRINEAAFPHYGEADWAAFARRLFREQDGRPVLDYDPDISVPIKAAADKAAADKAAAENGSARDAVAAPAADLWAMFDALAKDRPLLLVRGALSDLTTAETQAKMQARAPHMQAAEVAGVGHAPMLDEPEAVAALSAFLAAAD
jgi:pimeloyl-ACP methyl ester carboxylesterase